MKKNPCPFRLFPVESVDTKLEVLTNAGVKKRKRDMKYYRDRLKF